MKPEVLSEIERVVAVWEAVGLEIPKTLSKLRSRNLEIYKKLIPIYEERSILVSDIHQAVTKLSTTLHAASSVTSQKNTDTAMSFWPRALLVKNIIKSTQVFTFFLATLLAGGVWVVSKRFKSKRNFMVKNFKYQVITHTRYLTHAAQNHPMFEEYLSLLNELIENIQAEEDLAAKLSALNFY